MVETAFTLISCDMGTGEKIVENLKTIDGIKNATVTYGEYDIVIEAETENEAKMNDLITTKIRKIEKIRSTITLRATA